MRSPRIANISHSRSLFVLNRHRLLAVATASIATLLAAPAAHAATSTLTGITPVLGYAVGKTTDVTVAGTFTGADATDGYLELQLNPSDIACDPDSDTNYNDNSFDYQAIDVVPGSTAATPIAFTPQRAGTFLLCAYLTDTDYTTLARTSVPVTVRQMIATLNLGVVGAPVKPFTDATVNIIGSAEFPRSLYVTHIPATATCGVSPNDNPADGDIVFGDEVSGPFSRQITFKAAAVGSYRLCAYLAASGSDDQPSVDTTGTFDVSAAEAAAPSGGGAGRVTGPITAPVTQKPTTVPVPPSCKLKAVTVKRHTRLKIACTAAGTFTLRIKQGKKTTTKTFKTATTVFTAKSLKLKRKKASIAVFEGDRLLASAKVKVR